MTDLPLAAPPLTIRPMTLEDVDPYLAWRNAPEVSRWLMHTRSDGATLRDELAGEPDPNELTLVGVLDGRVVAAGYLSVRDGMGQDLGSAHVRSEALLGWNVDPAVHRRGFGTRMAEALLAVAFDELAVHRVTAGCFADNEGSWRVMERVGMRREQHGVQDSWHAELGWVDGYTYAMLRSEWVARAG
ncbi:GNAT family N-acetyltransferase [uncultured Phycicoccus sp.]|uniref:GNAT family N-acetyltransferase n=1 Tax=uncultured Phycicoccus sp. TaxID=661422 RepID=UPI0026311221|nr:GNAT family protein [uncultured Phycicoccus sp.]